MTQFHILGGLACALGTALAILVVLGFAELCERMCAAYARRWGRLPGWVVPIALAVAVMFVFGGVILS